MSARRGLAILPLTWLACATLALAYGEPSAVQKLLFAAGPPTEVRAQLAAFRDSLAGKTPLDAGEAWSMLGLSERRAGHPDEALAAYAQAYALRPGREEALALADLLFARNAHGDADSAQRVLEPERLEASSEHGESGDAVFVRLAWALAQTGHASEARALAAEHRGYLLTHAEWARRFASLALEVGEDSTVVRLTMPLLARSRGHDLDALALARRALSRRLPPGGLARSVALAAARADSLETSALPLHAGRALHVKMSDGQSLFAWGVAAPHAGAPLVLMFAPLEDPTLAFGDSLVAQLSRAGLAVALVDPRGARGSASESCPLPDAWLDHEEALLRRSAADVPALIAALAPALHADPHRVVVGACGSLAMVAALAARRADGVGAVLLVTATPAACDRGWLRTTLAKAALPVFVQEAPEEVFDNDLVDRIMAGLPQGQARIADARAPGHNLAIYRGDAALVPRFTNWLAAQWVAKAPSPSAPRRARPRRG